MLVFLQIDPTKSVGSLFGRSAPGETPAFKIDKKRRNPQEEEFPVQAMATLKLSKKCCTWGHRHYDLPTWGQIKTLLIKLKIWFLNKQCLRILKIFLSQCLLCLLLLPLLRLTWLITLISLIYLTPPLLQVVEWTDIGPVDPLMTQYICLLLGEYLEPVVVLMMQVPFLKDGQMDSNGFWCKTMTVT